MFIVLGLGNPGKEYASTRHNIGFMTVDLLCEKYGRTDFKSAHRSLLCELRDGAQRVVLAKPMTFMNLSGFAAAELMNWYKAEHNELIVIYDDIDLPVGAIRIREKGSSGSHNGMKSIIYQLGFDDFIRIRVGIGKASGELTSHVLGTPPKEERELLAKAMHDAADACRLIIGGELKKAQELYNKKGKTLNKEKAAEAASEAVSDD